MRPAALLVAAAMVLPPTTMLVTRWVQEGSRPRTERPASFQVYSFVPPARYEGRTADGTLRLLDTAHLPLLVRAVDTGRTVPARLCASARGLVEVRRLDGPQPGSYPC